MRLRYRVPAIVVPLVAGLAVLATALPAAAATLDQKLAVMLTWSQPTGASYNAWNSARVDQATWAQYTFDWSTDYCSASPDQPVGFDFRMPCWRHDFGYRNYKVVNQFPANKSRIDGSFYFDLKTKCATYSSFVRPACDSLAWTYYEAVTLFGSVRIDQASLDRAAELKARGEAQAIVADRVTASSA